MLSVFQNIADCNRPLAKNQYDSKVEEVLSDDVTYKKIPFLVFKEKAIIRSNLYKLINTQNHS